MDWTPNESAHAGLHSKQSSCGQLLHQSQDPLQNEKMLQSGGRITPTLTVAWKLDLQFRFLELSLQRPRVGSQDSTDFQKCQEMLPMEAGEHSAPRNTAR